MCINYSIEAIKLQSGLKEYSAISEKRFRTLFRSIHTYFQTRTNTRVSLWHYTALANNNKYKKLYYITVSIHTDM